MGKMNKLRRAIARDPKRWISKYSKSALPATYDNSPTGPKNWRPTEMYGWPGYRRFVRKVLRDLGHVVE